MESNGSQTAGASVTKGRNALSIRGLSKVYPGTRALDRVDLDVRGGEVLGLCGGNGSGKSTLIKILCGVESADAGEVQLGDAVIAADEIKSQAMHELGLRVVHQDLAVFLDLNVGENLMLGAGYPTRIGPSVDWRSVSDRARALIDRFEIEATPRTLLRDLPIATRAQIAIARALQDVDEGGGLIILDEPTASLPVHEARILHAAIRRLAAEGHAVVLVSHRLDEVVALADHATVLRDGRVAANLAGDKLTERELVHAILGGRTEMAQARIKVRPDSPTVLQVDDLSAGPLQGINISVRAGEILGVAGLLGSGRTELLRALYGDLSIDTGTVRINGEAVNFTRKDQAIAHGVVMIPEERATGGIFPTLTVDENMNVSVLRRYWRGLFKQRAMTRDVDQLRDAFKVKASSGSVAISTLSGGNQQKAVLARWLRLDPVVLLLDEPTQGVDVGARADIYANVRRLTDAGSAAIVVASDLEELAQVVDRAVVIQHGVIVAEVTGDDLSAHSLSERLYATDVAVASGR
ncbi:sugar ABC transporter ATP-binding protein [Aeromicrobium yanjiei]|uniref:sugar ABC transporter ATP-binding protein n=1 Tax=Aeromicrobium yanjiei TaxID=2662028 RepID=UPI00188E4D69|nr:sugar ABC transporter ATP-binding protein [Aeromicrobium yanjiei]